jgi:hypothetical protein
MKSATLLYQFQWCDNAETISVIDTAEIISAAKCFSSDIDTDEILYMVDM